MDFLDSGNKNEAKMIRFDPIIISDGTLRGAYSERALVKF
jgi:hypothetical protein